jgi:hypothetical protein
MGLQQNSSLHQIINTERSIGHIKGAKPGPTLIFVGGIHGNEPAGVFALQNVIRELKDNKTPLRGSVYAVAGNLWALQHKKRFQKEDLNRMWSFNSVKKMLNTTSLDPIHQDAIEQKDLYNTFKQILQNEEGPYYFFDLHTTSGQTIPFITVNDNLLNRAFTSQYPLPIVLGIEEYLTGPLLSYVNELGYVAFGFEGGQHDDPQAIENHRAFIYLTLLFSNCIDSTAFDVDWAFKLLENLSTNTEGFFEIVDRYKLNDNDSFKMEPGFANFQKVKRGQLLAKKNGVPVNASFNGKIFMPLYQDQGEDGFFMIQSIPIIFMKLSAVLRKLHIDSFLAMLPGICWNSAKKDSLLVNLRVARFFTKQFFHLLGYRSRIVDQEHVIMKNREKASRDQDYKQESWYRRN